MTRVWRALNEAAAPGVTGYDPRLSHTRQAAQDLTLLCKLLVWTAGQNGEKQMRLEMYLA